MKPATKRKNADRLGRQVVLGERGKPKIPVMNERQKSLLLFIARNRLVSFQEIHKHFGGDQEALRKNLRLFRATNVGFIKPCDQDVEERNPLRPVHYEIDDRGVTYLVNEGLLTSEPGRARIKLYKHALLATHGTASIEAGIKDNPHATLLPWDVLKENVPPETLKLDYPFGVPCTYDGQRSHAHADSPPFGIRLELPDHTKTRYFPGIEADTGSKNRTQMEEQLTKYLDIEANHTYVEHFGFKRYGFYVPFIVKNLYQVNRVEWLKQIILDITKGTGSKTILLKEYDPDAKLGYILTTDWHRAGHAPFNLLK
jgi:hypothetical protein